MKIPLKTKIAFWWWRKLQYKKPANLLQKISVNGDGISPLLFILPQDRTHLAIALHFLKTLTEQGHLDIIERIIGLREHKESINPELSIKMQYIAEEDVNRYGLLTTNALKRLTESKFKSVINLDPESGPISMQLVSAYSAKIRIGFGSDRAKDIYNISIENDHSNNYVEKGYKYIIEVLGL